MGVDDMLKHTERIGEAVIRRLPRYYHQLEALEEQGILRTSSQELAEAMDLTASQIRRDLNCFGCFGQQGYGYNVSMLREQIGKILGLKRHYQLIIVGAGNMGQALARYSGFARQGFIVAEVFDANPALHGVQLGKNVVRPVEDLAGFRVSSTRAVGVVATPGDVAPTVAKQLIQAGVKGIWNFAPVDLQMKGFPVENVRLSDSLYVLSYRMEEAAQASKQS